MRFMAIDSVSCASGDSAPREMPGATRRLRISVMLSTSSTGMGVNPVGPEVEQIAERDRRQLAHGIGVTTVGRVGKLWVGDRSLQHVDQCGIEGVGLAAMTAQLVEMPPTGSVTTSASQASACWSSTLRAMPGRPMPEMRDGMPGKNSPTSARESPISFEIIAAGAIGGNDADSHLGHDL